MSAAHTGSTLSCNRIDLINENYTWCMAFAFFKKITHHSPIDYINRYRVEMAWLKLAHTNDSITNIALACGFNDVSYFIKLFHRYKETSPLKYRQLIKSHSK